MKYCEDYGALLDPYIDGELSGDEAARVREHLTRCDGCRAYVQAALLMRDAFPDAEDAQVPDGFAESVCAAIRADVRQRKSVRRRRMRYGTALASLAACFTLLAALWSGPLRDRMDTQSTASVSSAQEMRPESEPIATEDSAAEQAAAAETEETEIVQDTAQEPAPSLYSNQNSTVSPKSLQEAQQDASVPPAATEPEETESTVTTQTTSETDGGQETSDTEAVPEVTVAEAAETVPSSSEEAETSRDAPESASAEDASAFFATLFLTREQAGSALDDLPGEITVSQDPDTGGTVYWLTADQFQTLVEQLGNPAYTLEGDGPMARVILLPE